MNKNEQHLNWVVDSIPANSYKNQITMYKYLFLGFFLLTCSSILRSQQEQVPMQEEFWDYDVESVRFAPHNGIDALYIEGSGTASARDLSFYIGTIEFDYYPTERGFCGIFFRRQIGEIRTLEFYSEFFYLRSFKRDDDMVPGAVQYAPFMRGTNLWDLLHDYEANALIKDQAWNRVKLVISQEQMKCYLNDQLVLWVPELLGPNRAGKLAFRGSGIYANLSIEEGNTGDVPQLSGADVFLHDVRYLREWVHSDTYDLPKNTAPNPDMFPDSTTSWIPISAGRAGLINLTEHITSPFVEGGRKLVWLSTTLESEYQQIKRLNIGFSDDIWVFVNGELLHVDRNTYGQPVAKQPNGRLHIDNSAIDLPLRQGENEIIIGIANDFFGWGLVARLDNMNGISDKKRRVE